MPISLAEEAIDRLAILELINRYGVAVDRKDNDLFRSCFTSDVEAVVDGIVMHGEEFLDPWAPGPKPSTREVTGGSAGIDRRDMSTHMMGDTLIRFDGDSADVETSCVAFLVGPRDGEPIMLVRGISYSDTFVRYNGEWKIARREHVFQWMFEAKPTKVA